MGTVVDPSFAFCRAFPPLSSVLFVVRYLNLVADLQGLTVLDVCERVLVWDTQIHFFS